jgi:hypothetical protein
MKARRLLESTSFGPEALKVICEAFDLAWGDVANAFDTSFAREDVRLTIATAVLEAATAASDGLNIDHLRLAGRLAIERKYPAAVSTNPAA